MAEIDLECYLVAYKDGQVFVNVQHVEKRHMGFGAFATGPQVDAFVELLKGHRRELEAKEKAGEKAEVSG